MSSAVSPPRRMARPCLKHCSPSPSPSPAFDTRPLPIPTPSRSPPSSRVHFPPTPTLSTTFPTHSKKTYDRRPLVVAPNACAMPERGCPGRTYLPGARDVVHTGRVRVRAPGDDLLDIVLDDSCGLDDVFTPLPCSPASPLATPTTPTPPPTVLPALIPDHSESEESDALTSPFSNSASTPERASHFLSPFRRGDSATQMDFLPHPPSRERSRERERERDRDGDAAREKEKEREARRRRRREREEERGRWRADGVGGLSASASESDGSCFGGF